MKISYVNFDFSIFLKNIEKISDFFRCRKNKKIRSWEFFFDIVSMQKIVIFPENKFLELSEHGNRVKK